MPDTKITALTAITTVDPAVDVLPIVDVSDTTMAASGTTKKITSNQILGAGGTATLASATITGDLTVSATGADNAEVNLVAERGIMLDGNLAAMQSGSGDAIVDIRNNLSGDITITGTLTALLGATLIALVLFVVFSRAASVLGWLGEIGTMVMMRLSAFILLCIGIDIMWTGWAELNGLPH